MLITLLPQNGIGNYSAPNPINYRAGCARARSSFSISTPNYSARVRHSERQIERNFRHGDGGNLSPSHFSWLHPIRARCHVDGEDDEGEGNDGACDDAGHGDAGDGDDHATAATGAAGGAPCGATKRVWGVPKLRGCAMRPRPLGPLVELPMGPRNTWRCADMSSWWRATASTWAICGAPYGATKRVSGAPI